MTSDLLDFAIIKQAFLWMILTGVFAMTLRNKHFQQDWTCKNSNSCFTQWYCLIIFRILKHWVQWFSCTTVQLSPVPVGQLFENNGWKLVLSAAGLRPVYNKNETCFHPWTRVVVDQLCLSNRAVQCGFWRWRPNWLLWGVQISWGSEGVLGPFLYGKECKVSSILSSES